MEVPTNGIHQSDDDRYLILIGTDGLRVEVPFKVFVDHADLEFFRVVTGDGYLKQYNEAGVQMVEVEYGLYELSVMVDYLLSRSLRAAPTRSLIENVVLISLSHFFGFGYSVITFRPDSTRTLFDALDEVDRVTGFQLHSYVMDELVYWFFDQTVNKYFVGNIKYYNDWRPINIDLLHRMIELYIEMRYVFGVNNYPDAIISSLTVATIRHKYGADEDYYIAVCEAEGTNPGGPNYFKDLPVNEVAVYIENILNRDKSFDLPLTVAFNDSFDVPAYLYLLSQTIPLSFRRIMNQLSSIPNVTIDFAHDANYRLRFLSKFEPAALTELISKLDLIQIEGWTHVKLFNYFAFNLIMSAHPYEYIMSIPGHLRPGTISTILKMELTLIDNFVNMMYTEGGYNAPEKSICIGLVGVAHRISCKLDATSNQMVDRAKKLVPSGRTSMPF